MKTDLVPGTDPPGGQGGFLDRKRGEQWMEYAEPLTERDVRRTVNRLFFATGIHAVSIHITPEAFEQLWGRKPAGTEEFVPHDGSSIPFVCDGKPGLVMAKSPYPIGAGTPQSVGQVVQ